MNKLIFSAFAALFLAIGAGAQENPIETISQNPGWCTIIHRWGFIGDSLSSGEHEYCRADGSKVYDDIYEYSWGQRMIAAIGGSAVGYNFSQGGETAKRWINNFWDYPMNHNANIRAKSHPCQAYIIALGCNDKRKIEAGNAKEDINLNDYTKNAETFAGYYGGIIQRVKELQPDAYFFVVTLPKQYGNKEFSEQIRAMAEIFDRTYVVDFEKYAPDLSAPGNREKYMLGGHLNAAGYQYVAWMFLTYINSIIEQNLPAFANVALMN